MERVERQRQLFRLPDTVIPHSVIALGYPQGDIMAPGESRYEEDRVHFPAFYTWAPASAAIDIVFPECYNSTRN